MSTNIPNQVNFLRSQRLFPQEAQPLSVEIDRMYTDVANAVNSRVIGFFPTNRPIQNGESWFLTSQRQSAFRQIYTFTGASPGNIPHGISWPSVAQISPKSCGSYTDGTNWYGVLYASSVAIAGQVSFYVTNVNIVILVDAGAPVPTSGTIVLEWISNA